MTDGKDPAVAAAGGGVYVTGSFSGLARFVNATISSQGLLDLYVVRYDETGTLEWAKRAGGPGRDTATAVAVDHVGSVALTGSFVGTASFDGKMVQSAQEHAFIAGLASSGMGLQPAIVRQPVSQTVWAGENAEFSVIGTGEPIPVVQWRHKGREIPGATNAVLFIANAGLGHSGEYVAVLSNVHGSTTSSAATLTVITAAPSISVSPIQETLVVGSDAVFTAQATGKPAPTYQWELNGIPIPGGTSPILRLDRITRKQAGTYIAVARNDFGVARSEPSTLAILLARELSPEIESVEQATVRRSPGPGTWPATPLTATDGNGNAYILGRFTGHCKLETSRSREERPRRSWPNGTAPAQCFGREHFVQSPLRICTLKKSGIYM